MKKKIICAPSWVENLEKKFVPSHPLPAITLTVIVPVYNCSERAAITLESIRSQHYSYLEVIVIDAGSTDRTLEVVSSYASMIHRIYTVTEFNLPEMMNCAISLASGQYITFLLPGSFYLSSYALSLMAEAAMRENYPDLLYSGSIQKEIKRPAYLVQDSFNKSVLAKGHLPSTIVAVWFLPELFTKIGKFDTSYKERAPFDFFCRCTQTKNCKIHLVDRVLVDFDYGSFSYGKQARIFKQTWQIILRYFGWKKMLSWLYNRLG